MNNWTQRNKEINPRKTDDEDGFTFVYKDISLVVLTGRFGSNGKWVGFKSHLDYNNPLTLEATNRLDAMKEILDIKKKELQERIDAIDRELKNLDHQKCSVCGCSKTK